MALIEFKNLPDTSTPINAENLNNNFTECNNIIESGSNANGSYIKYSDGTMICTKKISGTANLSIWFSPIIFADISGGSFASNFISAPNVQITNGNSQTLAYSVYNTSTSSAGTIRLIGISTAAMEKEYEINILAIGKWK